MTHQEDSQYGVAPVENFARASTVGATTMVSIERGHYPTFYQLLAHALLHGGHHRLMHVKRSTFYSLSSNSIGSIVYALPEGRTFFHRRN